MKRKILFALPIFFLTLVSCNNGSSSISEAKTTPSIKLIGKDSLKVGEVSEYSYEIKDSSEDRVIFSVSDQQVLSIDNEGKVTALKVGEADVIVQLKGEIDVKDSIHVNVIAPVFDTSMVKASSNYTLTLNSNMYGELIYEVSEKGVFIPTLKTGFHYDDNKVYELHLEEDGTYSYYTSSPLKYDDGTLATIDECKASYDVSSIVKQDTWNFVLHSSDGYDVFVSSYNNSQISKTMSFFVSLFPQYASDFNDILAHFKPALVACLKDDNLIFSFEGNKELTSGSFFKGTFSNIGSTSYDINPTKKAFKEGGEASPDDGSNKKFEPGK